MKEYNPSTYVGGLSFPEKRFFSRAKALSIPSHLITPFLNSIETWVLSSGKEWTVSRIKSIKLDFVREYSGMDPCSSWISKNRKGRIKGNFSPLLSWGLSNDKRFARTLSLLQAYTAFVAPRATENQLNKFVTGVQSNPVEIPKSLSLSISKAWKKIGGRVHRNLGLPRPIWTIPVSESKREPSYFGGTVIEGSDTIGQAYGFLHTPLGEEIHRTYPNIVDAALEGTELHRYDVTFLPDKYPINTVGKISLIQEPGYKLRAVANPARIYQCLLEPLGKRIYSLLKELPWDCTFDQSKGFPMVQERLTRSETVHSIDLSGATDYFPLSLQITVLQSIFGETDYIQLFEFLSRSPWEFQDSTIRWNKGQPLGLYPSFGSFALTHGLLLYTLNNYRHDNEFYVLGDDVIILNDELADKYLEVITELNCPVSYDKSLSSNLLCEFGGKIISKYSVIPQYKWRDCSDESFIDFVRNIGPKALQLLKPRQRRVARRLLEVPDFLGGIGFNPQGKPLEERVSDSQFLWDTISCRKYLLSYQHRVNELNYPPTLLDSYSYAVTDINFDQKFISSVSKFLPHFLQWYGIMGANLYTLDENLRFPLENSGCRRSLLESLELKLC